ncbi:MAG: insulinase family protein, partial [Clostridia bacterium]
YFEGHFPTITQRDWADTAHETTPTYLKKFKDIEQANIAIGMPSINFSNKLDMPLMLVNNMVGGGMSSRLFQEIRENLGLAYNVYTYPSAYINNGVMSIYIGTNLKSVSKSIEATAKVIDDIKKNGLSKKEIERGIQQLKGTYVLGQESTGALMRVYAKYALFNDELFDIDKKLEEIDAITPEQVNEVIAQCFDTTKASVTYVGKSVKGNLLEIFNS